MSTETALAASRAGQSSRVQAVSSTSSSTALPRTGVVRYGTEVRYPADIVDVLIEVKADEAPAVEQPEARRQEPSIPVTVTPIRAGESRKGAGNEQFAAHVTAVQSQASSNEDLHI